MISSVETGLAVVGLFFVLSCFVFFFWSSSKFVCLVIYPGTETRSSGGARTRRSCEEDLMGDHINDQILLM